MQTTEPVEIVLNNGPGGWCLSKKMVDEILGHPQIEVKLEEDFRQILHEIARQCDGMVVLHGTCDEKTAVQVRTHSVIVSEVKRLAKEESTFLYVAQIPMDHYIHNTWKIVEDEDGYEILVLDEEKLQLIQENQKLREQVKQLEKSR